MALCRIGTHLAVAVALTASAASAETERQGQKHLTLVGIPAATVAPHGMVFGSLALTDRRAGFAGRDNDGSLALGFGLGSAEDGLGLQVTASIASLSRTFGDAGSFGLKVSRRVVAGDEWNAYLGLSADYLAPWGKVKGPDPALTAAFTAFTNLRMGAEIYPLMLTVGAGTRIRNNDRDPGGFAGVGIGLTENLAVSAAWTDHALDLGLGLRVPGLDGLDLTLAVNDVTDRSAGRRATLTATWALQNVFGR